jgi:hypothetical protein
MARRGVVEEKMLAFDSLTAMPAAATLAQPKEIQKEGVSDYFLYTIEGRESIKNEWSKRLPSFTVRDVPVAVRYEHNPRRYGSGVIKFYKFKNKDEEDDDKKPPAEKLGQTPLPNGVFRVFKENAADKEGSPALSYVNAYTAKYIPIGEDVELNLGDDGLITLESKVMDFRREAIRFNDSGNITGHDIIENRRVLLRNSKREDVEIEVTQFFGGDYEIESKEDYERRAADEIKFTVTVPALGERAIDLTVTTHHGENSSRPDAQPTPVPPRPTRPRRPVRTIDPQPR